MKQTVVITLGRNVKNEAMSTPHWIRFIREVHDLLTHLGAEIILEPLNIGGSFGRWTDGDGTVVEESAAAFVCFVGNSHAIMHLSIELNAIRAKYKQDAIGFIVADGDDNILTGV